MMHFHIWSERWELFLNVDFSSGTTIVLAELEYIVEVIRQALKLKYGSQYAHCFLTFGRPRRWSLPHSGLFVNSTMEHCTMMDVWWWTHKAAENKPWIVAVKHWRYQKENAIKANNFEFETSHEITCNQFQAWFSLSAIFGFGFHRFGSVVHSDPSTLVPFIELVLPLSREETCQGK